LEKGSDLYNQFIHQLKIVKKKTTVIQNTNIQIPYFNFNGKHIWGATAMILSEFLEVIKRNELNGILF